MSIAPTSRRGVALRRVLAVAAVLATTAATATVGTSGAAAEPTTTPSLLAAEIAPIIALVSPSTVPSDRDQRIKVYGAALDGATSVTFGGVPGTNVTVSNGTVAVDVPRHPEGVVDLVVTSPDGTSNVLPVEFVDTHAGVVSRVPLRIAHDDMFSAYPPRCLYVAGTKGVPAGASGVILNATVVDPRGPGYVVLYPEGGSTPTTSTVNFEPGREVANAAFVAVGPTGRICYESRGADSVLLLDVTGFVMGDSGVEMQDPVRLLDTRPGAGHAGAITGPVRSGAVQTVQVAGKAGVPAGARAVIVNATVTDNTGLGNLRLFPAGSAVPNASVVNYAVGAAKANLAIVPLSSSGKLSFVSDAGASTAHVILDVTGYVTEGSVFQGATPTRVLDTRSGSGHLGAIPGSLSARTAYTVTVPSALVPAGATSVVLNVTAIGPSSYGNLRVYPSGLAAVPDASTINYIPGRDIPNLVVVDLPDSGPATVTLYSDMSPGGTVHVAADVAGFVVAP